MGAMQDRAAIASGRAVARPPALTDGVYEAILDRITSLEIAPGARINVDTLARELGVSQTPIREALSRLEAEGLVLKTHLIGHHAGPKLTREQTEQLFQLRLLIEPAGAGLAAERLTPEARERLRQLHDEMSNVSRVPRPTYSEFARKDAAFHGVIAEASGNAFLAQTLAKLHTHVHIFRLVIHARVTVEAIAEHGDLLAALLRGDAQQSESSMRAHILASRDRILTLWP